MDWDFHILLVYCRTLIHVAVLLQNPDHFVPLPEASSVASMGYVIHSAQWQVALLQWQPWQKSAIMMMPAALPLLWLHGIHE
jgi:hypothetical protein